MWRGRVKGLRPHAVRSALCPLAWEAASGQPRTSLFMRPRDSHCAQRSSEPDPWAYMGIWVERFGMVVAGRRRVSTVFDLSSKARSGLLRFG
jgi:hypothetical protein